VDSEEFSHPQGLTLDDLCTCKACIFTENVEEYASSQHAYLLGAQEARQRVKQAELDKRGPITSRVLTYPQLRDLPRPDMLIPEVLYTGAVAITLGNSQVGKTWIKLAKGACGATGRNWPHTHEPGQLVAPFPVLYIAAEDGGSIASRLECWERAHDVSLENAPFHVHPGALDLLSDAQIEQLEQLIIERGYRLVIVDTIAASLGGEEENNENFSKIIQNMRILTRAMDVHGGGAVDLVHHFGKDSSKGARGGSSLFNDADIVWEISGNMNYIRMDCKKWKIDRAPDPIALKLDTTEYSKTHIVPISGGGIDAVPVNEHSRLRMAAVLIAQEHAHLNDGLGPSTNDILAGLKDLGTPFRKTNALDAIRSLDMDGTFKVNDGKRGSKYHQVINKLQPDT
jgi:hypothetical protein